LFLKGRYYSQKYSAEGWTRAIEFFQRAIEMQPDHAPAYAGMAVCYGCLWFFGLRPAADTVPHCKAATHRALEADGTLADAYAALAMITFFYDWEWESAEQAYRQSIALNPNDAEVLSYYALFLAFAGRTDEATGRAQRALELDPLSPLINMNVGWTYFSVGRADGALAQAAKMIEIEPGFYGAYWLKGAVRLAEGRYQDAVSELERAVALGGHQIVVADLASAYGLSGRQEDAAIILDQLLERRRLHYVPAICIARVYCRVGKTEKAVEWLETAFGERNGEMVFLQGEIAGAPEDDSLARLAGDPRVNDLLRRMSLPQ
jgi:tetratricopeptide (TPR) repeat protein